MSTKKKSNDASKGGRNGGQGRNTAKTNGTPTAIVLKFEGMCTKDLKGKVMTFSENKASMSAKFIKFEAAVYNAAGKALLSLSREIDIKRPLVLRDFITDVVHDPMDYTTYDHDGDEIINKKVRPQWRSRTEHRKDQQYTNCHGAQV